jgi:hypothetical protein
MAEALDFARVARARNVPCSVWIVPEKWRVYGDEIDGLDLPTSRLRLYQRVREHLLVNGVDAPDLLAELRQLRRRFPDSLLYSPSDTHLTGEATALLVERHVPRLLGLDPATVRARLQAVPRGEPVVHYGDLLAMLQITRGSAAARRFSGQKRPWLTPPAHDRPRSDVFVMGDSTMAFDDRLLPRLLQVATGLRVDSRYVMEGMLRSATAREEYADHSPRLMLLSMGERRFASEW